MILLDGFVYLHLRVMLPHRYKYLCYANASGCVVCILGYNSHAVVKLESG